MMGWIGDHDWQAWLVIALLLAGAEVATLDLTLLMLAAGAGAAALVAALGIGVVLQVLVAVVVAVAMLGLVRPNVIHRLHSGPTLLNTPQALVGKSALVLEQVTPHGGRVKLHGEVWSARSIDEFTTIEPGSAVEVAEIDGATAVVYEV